jgi:anti-anti-sigma factor
MSMQRTMDGDTLVLTDTQTGETVRIQESVSDGRAVIRPSGRLGMEVSHDLEDELTAMALMCREVVIEMPEVSYIANAVMSAILRIQHMAEGRKGRMLLKDMNEDIYGRFEEMGLDGVLEISRIGE